MRSLPALLTVLLLLAACAAEPPAATPSAPTDEGWTLVITDGEPGAGPGISVSEALTHGPTDDIVLVTGALFVNADGTVLLCDAIAESFPPQCGGDRIAVDGLDLATVELEEANGVRWAEGVVLLGSVE
jgi:hypothetical protein